GASEIDVESEREPAGDRGRAMHGAELAQVELVAAQRRDQRGPRERAQRAPAGAPAEPNVDARRRPQGAAAARLLDARADRLEIAELPARAGERGDPAGAAERHGAGR